MVVGSDIPAGQQVRWFSGGVMKTETKTVSAGDVSATYVTLAKKAEWGSLVVTKAGALIAVLEKTALGAGAATEALGCNTFSYTGLTLNDALVIQYLDVETTPLTQIATCLDVKTSISADTKQAAIHGQANKIKTVGAIEQDASLEQFCYTQAFLAQIIGDQITGSPAANLKKLTTHFTGMRKIGCLVGKVYDTGYVNCIYKYFLFGAQATGLDKDFPTEDMYKDSMKFMVDEYLEVALTA